MLLFVMCWLIDLCLFIGCLGVEGVKVIIVFCENLLFDVILLIIVIDWSVKYDGVWSKKFDVVGVMVVFNVLCLYEWVSWIGVWFVLCGFSVMFDVVVLLV